jgi:hypothetical protein
MAMTLRVTRRASRTAGLGALAPDDRFAARVAGLRVGMIPS